MNENYMTRLWKRVKTNKRKSKTNKHSRDDEPTPKKYVELLTGKDLGSSSRSKSPEDSRYVLTRHGPSSKVNLYREAQCQSIDNDHQKPRELDKVDIAAFIERLFQGAIALEDHLKKVPREHAEEAVNQRLSNHVDDTYDRFTPLGYAVMRNDVNLLDVLLRCSPDFKARPCFLKYPESYFIREIDSSLHLAALMGCKPEIFDRLLPYCQLMDLASYHTKASLLRYMTTCENRSVANDIMSMLKDSNNKIDLREEDLRFLLHESVKYNNISTVKLLLDLGVNINEKCRLGKTALIISCGPTIENKELVELLLKYGANVHLVDSFNRTAMHYAIRFCSKGIIQLLLDAGCDIFTEDSRGKSCFQYIFNDGDRRWFRRRPVEDPADLIELIMDSRGGVLRLQYVDDFFKAALVLSKHSNVDDKLVNLFNENSQFISTSPASPNQDKLFIRCVKHQLVKAVTWLVDRESNVHVTDKHGWSALHLCLLTENMEIFWLLVQSGCDINARTPDGLTPFWIMLRMGLEDLAIKFMDLGADFIATVKILALYRLSSAALPELPAAVLPASTASPGTLEWARLMQQHVTPRHVAGALGLTRLAHVLAQRGVPETTRKSSIVKATMLMKENVSTTHSIEESTSLHPNVSESRISHCQSIENIPKLKRYVVATRMSSSWNGVWRGTAARVAFEKFVPRRSKSLKRVAASQGRYSSDLPD